MLLSRLKNGCALSAPQITNKKFFGIRAQVLFARQEEYHLALFRIGIFEEQVRQLRTIVHLLFLISHPDLNKAFFSFVNYLHASALLSI